MPFCRECGKEIEEDWKTCPYCSMTLIPEKSSISDTVIMGDYNVQTNIESKGNVKNHILTLIDALNEGREDRALEIFELAKKIDYDLAIQLYEVDYNKQITECKINLLKKELSLTLKETDISGNWDAKDVIAKSKDREKRMAIIISKFHDLFDPNDINATSLDLLFQIWRNNRVGVKDTFGELSYDWFITKYEDIGDVKGSEEVKFIKKLEEIKNQEGEKMDKWLMALILFTIFVFLLIVN